MHYSESFISDTYCDVSQKGLPFYFIKIHPSLFLFVSDLLIAHSCKRDRLYFFATNFLIFRNSFYNLQFKENGLENFLNGHEYGDGNEEK
jgi:hypothetical protein